MEIFLYNNTCGSNDKTNMKLGGYCYKVFIVKEEKAIAEESVSYEKTDFVK